MTPHTSALDPNFALNLEGSDPLPCLTGMDALMETDSTGFMLAPIVHFDSPLGENLVLGETVAFSPVEDDLAASVSGDLVGSSRTLLPTAAGDSLPRSDWAPSHSLAAAVARVRESLQSWRDSSNFASGVQAVYGHDVDVAQAAVELDTLLAGAGALAHLQVVDSLGTAAGAYAAADDTLYLAEAWLSNPHRAVDDMARVILEELGHALDARLHETDTAGDEGALFAAAVTGQELSAAERAAIAVEDDSATLVIEGQALAVEQFELPDLVGVFADADNDYLIGGQTDFTFRIQNQGTQAVGAFAVDVLAHVQRKCITLRSHYGFSNHRFTRRTAKPTVA